MIYFVFILVFLYILPVFIRFDLLFDKNIKKLFISCYFFGFIKILSGYFTLEEQYIALHLSEKKAVLLEPYDVFKKGKSYKAFKGFEIYSVKFCLETGENISEMMVKILVSYKLIADYLFSYYLYKKNFATTRNEIIINEQTDIVRLISSIKAIFNIHVIITMIIKKIMEKISNAKKRK